jgi:hypothetical protein
VVLSLSQDGACTDSSANFRENSLKGDLSNDITLNPPLFSLVNTFNAIAFCDLSYQCINNSASIIPVAPPILRLA